MSFDERSILVTGGAGFIGSHSVDALLNAGYRVRVLDNLINGSRSNLPAERSGFEFVKGDVRDIETVTLAMNGVSHCLHLAAQVAVKEALADPGMSAEHNVLGSVNVFQAARKAGVRRVVYASSAAVYGNDGEVPLAETMPCRPASPYGLEKYVDEQYADLFRSVFDVSSIGLRYFNVFGLRQDPRSPYAGVISHFANCVTSGEQPRVFGDGEQTRDFVYVEDVVRGNLAALFSGCEGVCNIASQRGTSINELLRTLQGVTGCTCQPRYEPVRDGDIRHSIGDVRRMRKCLDVVPAWSLESGVRSLVSKLKCG